MHNPYNLDIFDDKNENDATKTIIRLLKDNVRELQGQLVEANKRIAQLIVEVKDDPKKDIKHHVDNSNPDRSEEDQDPLQQNLFGVTQE